MLMHQLDKDLRTENTTHKHFNKNNLQQLWGQLYIYIKLIVTLDITVAGKISLFSRYISIQHSLMQNFLVS